MGRDFLLEDHSKALDRKWQVCEAEMGLETLNLEVVTGCILWIRGRSKLSYTWLELAAPQIYDFTLHHNA